MNKKNKEFTEKLLWEILNIPSYTGNELMLAKYFEGLFKKNKFKIRLIMHSKERASLIATFGKPNIAYCTHLDTAIEWEKPSKVDNTIYGIGACDAKGALACQTTAALELAKQGKDISVAFLAGEESDSIGARYLKNHKTLPVKYIIHGEPTNAEFINKTGSVVELELIARGKKGHSSCKNNDISSIFKLINTLTDLKEMCTNNDYIFHIGNIDGGGVTPSSFPEISTALLQIRGYEKSQKILNLIKDTCHKDISIKTIYLNDYCELITLPNYNNKSVWFGSDAGILQDKYEQLLVGPGDIKRAHKKEEYIQLKELYKGVKCYLDAYNFLDKGEKNDKL